MTLANGKRAWSDRFCDCPPIGGIYEDHSGKGKCYGRRSNAYRAQITIGGQRYRHWSTNYHECERFLFDMIFYNQKEIRSQKSINSLLRN